MLLSCGLDREEEEGADSDAGEWTRGERLPDEEPPGESRPAFLAKAFLRIF